MVVSFHRCSSPFPRRSIRTSGTSIWKFSSQRRQHLLYFSLELILFLYICVDHLRHRFSSRDQLVALLESRVTDGALLVLLADVRDGRNRCFQFVRRSNRSRCCFVLLNDLIILVLFVDLRRGRLLVEELQRWLLQRVQHSVRRRQPRWHDFRMHTPLTVRVGEHAFEHDVFEHVFGQGFVAEHQSTESIIDGARLQGRSLPF